MSTKTYESCPKKHKARQETIILPYRQHFGQSIPKDKQYITLCATHHDDNKKLLKGSELHQLLEAKLITIDQFVGIDYDEEIIRENREAIPDASWDFGDLYKTLIELGNNGKLNPAIVNCDLLQMPKAGTVEVAKIMALLSSFDDIMLISNCILKNRGRRCSQNEMVHYLYRHEQFKFALQCGWKLHDNKSYGYHGTGKDYTDMGSVVFYRQK